MEDARDLRPLRLRRLSRCKSVCVCLSLLNFNDGGREEIVREFVKRVRDSMVRQGYRDDLRVNQYDRDVVEQCVVKLRGPTQFVNPSARRDVVKDSRGVKCFTRVPKMANVATMMRKGAVNLCRGYPPRPTPSVTGKAFTPILYEGGHCFRPIVFCLLVPTDLYRLGLEGPSFSRLPNTRTAGRFRPQVIFCRPYRALLVRIVGVVIASRRVVSVNGCVKVNQGVALPLGREGVTRGKIRRSPLPAWLRRREVVPRPGR